MTRLIDWMYFRCISSFMISVRGVRSRRSGSGCAWAAVRTCNLVGEDFFTPRAFVNADRRDAHGPCRVADR